ncbi:MAG: hypothetical protein ACT4O3_09745, partial [Elusimicrobiota bacterium]
MNRGPAIEKFLRRARRARAFYLSVPAAGRALAVAVAGGAAVAAADAWLSLPQGWRQVFWFAGAAAAAASVV